MVVGQNDSVIGGGIDVFLYGAGHGYSSFLLDELNECFIHEFESCSK